MAGGVPTAHNSPADAALRGKGLKGDSTHSRLLDQPRWRRGERETVLACLLPCCQNLPPSLHVSAAAILAHHHVVCPRTFHVCFPLPFCKQAATPTCSENGSEGECLLCLCVQRPVRRRGCWSLRKCKLAKKKQMLVYCV